MIKAHAAPVPADSVLAPLYVGAHLLDAFAIHLPAGSDVPRGDRAIPPHDPAGEFGTGGKGDGGLNRFEGNVEDWRGFRRRLSSLMSQSCIEQRQQGRPSERLDLPAQN